MKILQVPDGMETSALIESILKELLAPVAEVELLKRKPALPIPIGFAGGL